MIDLHCHILPGIDDGPPTVAGALALATEQAASRVQTVAATPHVTAKLPNTAAAIGADVQRLNDALAGAAIGVRVVAGGEVDLAYAAELPDEELHRLTLGGAGWLLLEAPLRDADDAPARVRAVAQRGHRILLAHPERSPAFLRAPAALDALVREHGVRVQVTATALTGSFGTTVQRHALELAQQGLIHVVASDAHDARKRPPGLVAEIAGAGLDAHRTLWTEENPAAILAGADVPHVSGRPQPRQRRGFLRRR